jgi:hypothetical protein
MTQALQVVLLLLDCDCMHHNIIERYNPGSYTAHAVAIDKPLR